MAALGKSGSKGKKFLAGKFWGEDSMENGLDARYGVLRENGDDLSIIASKQ